MYSAAARRTVSGAHDALSPKPSLRPPAPRHAPPSRQQTQRAAAQRAWGFGCVIVLLFLALTARLWYLQIAHGDDFRDAAAANQARRIRTRAPRGTITDRHGVLLAANRPRLAIYATPGRRQRPGDSEPAGRAAPRHAGRNPADHRRHPAEPL